jgi:predicted RND superfamily exporter protein
MKDSFFARKNSLGISNAMLVLMLVFFVVPFALRGARMAVQKTENNVKDWLPDSFRETEELAWFANRFVSEQFVVATWPGCTEDDQRFKMFVDKLNYEAEATLDLDGEPKNERARAKQVGREYGIFFSGDYHENWAGENERWLTSETGRWFYIKPDGKLYRWDGRNDIVGFAGREFSKVVDSFKLDGQFITKFEEKDKRPNDPNAFYADPMLVTAPLFRKIETGPELVEQLAGPDGSLHRVGQEIGSQRDAMDRLTGSLFAPPVPTAFDWQVDSMRAWLGESFVEKNMLEGWDEVLAILVQQKIDEDYNGDRALLAAAPPLEHSALWYEFFDQLAVEPPARQTCVLITLTDLARENLKKVLGRGMLGTQPGRVIELAAECGVTPPPKPTMAPPPFSWIAANQPIIEPSLRMGGPPVDNVAIDEEGTITLVRLIGYSILLGLGLSYICLRSVKLTAMVFFVGGTAAIGSLSFVWWCNTSVDAVLLTMPSLVYVLGMSGAIHIINYYRDAAIDKGRAGAAERAVSHAILPCSLAAVTTAIGLGSLGVSNILPIRKFGIFSAMGVVATLFLLFLYLPAALTVFAPPIKSASERTAKLGNRLIDRFWARVADVVIRRHRLTSICCLIAMAICGYGLTKIETNVQLLKLFDSKARIIQDYSWLEKNFGRLVPMELVVRFPQSLQRSNPMDGQRIDSASDSVADAALDPTATRILATNEYQEASPDDDWLARLTLLERAEAVGIIQQVVEDEFSYGGQDKIGSAMSAITLVPPLPKPAKGLSATRIAANGLLMDSFPKLLETDYVRVEDGGAASGTELWRISLRLGALNDVDYGQFVSQMRLAVEPVVQAYQARTVIIDSITSHGTKQNNSGYVLVMGASNPRKLEDETRQRGEDRPVDCKAIYAKTLSAVLTNDAIKRTTWYEPSINEVTQDVLDAKIKEVQCVVLLGDDASIDAAKIQATNPSATIIDAREGLERLQTVAFEKRFATGKAVSESINGDNMDVVYTGVVPVVYKAQRTLLESLIQSISWAFVMIGCVMAILMTPYSTIAPNLTIKNISQAVLAGFSSMAPNVFPVVIIFGLMGLMAVQVDIGTMMTASVAMGVAVDDTIHFLAWFRDGMREGMNRATAIKHAFSRVAPAMTQTTLIGGLGLSVFALSTFTPTQRFGTLMLALLAAALVGDLLFLPALLASPLGKFFEPGKEKKKGKENSTSSSDGEPVDEDHSNSTSNRGVKPTRKVGPREPHLTRSAHKRSAQSHSTDGSA